MLHATSLVGQSVNKGARLLKTITLPSNYAQLQKHVRASLIPRFHSLSTISVTTQISRQAANRLISTTAGVASGQDSISDQKISFTKNSCNTEEVETHGQPLHRFGSSEKLEQAANRYDVHMQEDRPLEHGHSHYHVDGASERYADMYHHDASVSLSACMQSQVPEPYGKTPTHMNMPGGIGRREHKYVQGRLSDMSGKREFSTATTSGVLRDAAKSVDEHGNPTYAGKEIEVILRDPCPQGIQGEDCEQFKLWLSNCLQHGDLVKCEVLANEYIAGRKTLAQLFLEYDLEIKRVVTSRQDSLPDKAM